MQFATTPSLERVEVVVVGDVCDTVGLAAKIRSWFADTGVRVDVRQELRLDSGAMLAPGETAGVRVWLLARAPTTPWLYLSLQPKQGGVPRYLVRDMVLEHGLDELGVEQVAQVIYLSSVALWAGQVQSTRRQFEDRLSLASAAVFASSAVAPQPQVVRPPASTRRERPERVDAMPQAWAVRSGFAYAMRLQGREGVGQGPVGIARLVRWVSGTTWEGGVAAQLILPHQSTAGPVSLDLRGYSLRASYTWSSRERNGLVLTTEIGPGVDLVRYSVKSTATPGIQGLPPSWDTRPIAWLGVGIEKRVPRFQVGVQTTLAVQLVKTHYNLINGGQHLAVLTPWMIQPGVIAYLTL